VRRSLAFLLGVALLAGCGTGTAATTRPTLDVVMADDWETAPVVRQVVRDFERDREVRVQIQAAPFSQIPDLVRNAIDLGDPFDLAHWHAFAAAADGLAEPLDAQWDEAGLSADDFLPGAVDDVTWDGRRYGVPLDVNALVLLVNDDALAAAGLSSEDLRDADGFLEAARALQDASEVDHAITVTASSWTAYGWIRAFGGQLLERAGDGTVTFTFDDPRTIAALDLLGSLATEGIGTPPFAPDLSLDSVEGLSQGHVAMHASGSWDLAVTQRARGAAVSDVRVLPLPRGEGDTGTVLGGSSLFVPRGAEHADLAFDFAQALTAADVGIELAREEGRLPARLDAYGDATFSDGAGMAAFVEELPEADVMPLIAYPDLAAAFSGALERVLKGQQTAADAMAELQGLAERTATR
jgi:multiple sugar transport system substrate-binding protein